MIKKRVFPGIQPTGNLHIGNYLGTIQHWVALQTFDSIFCIVGLHTITTLQEPTTLKSKTRETAGLLFAAGFLLTRIILTPC